MKRKPMKKLLLSTILVAVIFVLPSCKYNNQEELYPKCDTTAVTYTGTIVPILQSNCYRCHGTSTNTGSGGIVLQDYNILKGFAADGRLYGNAAHLPGYIPMPYDGGKLSDCDLAKLKNWVDKGYPNN
jgi:hypothetical protein